ncbi:MAG: histidinol-phosphatase [Desulfovibrionaceae bacterium]|nr:histidinol-phosphatase [Desulfovibrionaceae bacterium]
MRPIDLHIHTRASHATDSADAMLSAALGRDVAVLGFSEHVPRPAAFAYPNDYRDRLAKAFPVYVAEVEQLKATAPATTRVLLGAEFDYFPGYEEHIALEMARWNLDYAIGSVHFLENWGFDFTARDWRDLDEAVLFEDYAKYFGLLRQMAESGLFHIAAHLDLIKIFSIEPFTAWAATDTARTLFERVLAAMARAGVALEISSAGLRKPCREIYPCAPIMRLAREAGLEVSFASDAHCVRDVARDFKDILAYARSFGFSRCVWFDRGKPVQVPF